MSIHMATDRPLPILLFCNESRSSLICCLVQSGSISLCSNSCMKFRRGHLGCSTTGAAVLLMPFSGLKEKGGHICCSPTVLIIKPQVRCRSTLQDQEPGTKGMYSEQQPLGSLSQSVKSSLMRDSVLSCPQAWRTGDSQFTCTFGSAWYRNTATFKDFALLHGADTGQVLA